MEGWKLERKYQRIDHPQHTQRIFITHKMANFSNGDECDFRYFEARSYKIEDKEKIAAFYQGLKVSLHGYNGHIDPVLIGFYFSEEYERFTPNPLGQKWLAKARRKASGPFYILTAGIGGSDNAPPWVDWRCV